MNAREKIISTLGKLPEKCERNAALSEKTDAGKFTMQTIEYNTEKYERIKAILLIPKNISEKVPAVVAAHQHAGQYHLGKSEPAGLLGDSMYHYGKELAERGFIVICPDHLGFEERLPPQSELDKYRIDAALYERELFCRAIMMGTTLQGKYVSDLSAAVDVLCSIDSVDSERIGVIGHSLGGQEALWLTFFEARIKAGVSSCGFATVGSIFGWHIPHNFAMFTFGGFDAGDTPAVLREIGRAGKAFMFTNGTKDGIFPMHGVQELLKCHEDFPDEKNFKSHIFEGGHSFPEELRREAYEFLEMHLL
ncbi:MAG: alpha/beta fold hydrolase [Oscillospiraceae bacterium]|nr:alpha/beta fold hydrolase [Oscillospiraceae bacterium]